MVHRTTLMILVILSMETLASPLNLEVSIKGVQNGNTTNQSAESCVPMGQPCPNLDPDSKACCKNSQGIRMNCHNVDRKCFPDCKKPCKPLDDYCVCPAGIKFRIKI